MVKKLLVGALLATGLAFSAQAQDFDLGELAKQGKDALDSLGGQLGGLLDGEAKCGLEFATKIFENPDYQSCFEASFSIFGEDGKIDCSKSPPKACFEFAKKANELVSPECKEFFAEETDQDIEAEVQSWEEACKELNAAAGDAQQDDADDDDDAQQALDDAAKDAKDAATTATDEVQEIVDVAKDDIAKVTDGAFTVSTIFSALALFAALY